MEHTFFRFDCFLAPDGNWTVPHNRAFTGHTPSSYKQSILLISVLFWPVGKWDHIFTLPFQTNLSKQYWSGLVEWWKRKHFPNFIFSHSLRVMQVWAVWLVEWMLTWLKEIQSTVLVRTHTHLLLVKLFKVRNIHNLLHFVNKTLEEKSYT